MAAAKKAAAKKTTMKSFPNTPSGRKAAAKWAGAEGPKSSRYVSKTSKGGEPTGFFGSPGRKVKGYEEIRGQGMRKR